MYCPGQAEGASQELGSFFTGGAVHASFKIAD